MTEPTDARGRRIVAVSVTYNRRELVTRLVRAAEAQTVRPDLLILVDNASTDGTAEAVRTLDARVPVQVVALESNTGGAGGFRAGQEAAMAAGADLIWLMDDDGTPAPDCLERLLPHVGTHDFLGPLVVDEDDEDALVFPIRLPGTARVVRRTSAAVEAAHDGLIEQVVIPFNGVLLTRELVERIGTVDARYFIWGDDVEYLWRSQRDGARIATVTGARFRHPNVGDLGTPTILGQTYNHSPSDLKAYCMARNNVVNLRTYRGPAHALVFVAKTVWFYTVTKPDLGRLRLMLGGIRDGFRGDFSGHERFLR